MISLLKNKDEQRVEARDREECPGIFLFLGGGVFGKGLE